MLHFICIENKGGLEPARALVTSNKLILFFLCLLAALTWGCRDSLTSIDSALKASWESYCRHFISPEGRVIIPERHDGTISEAQAYALLRAVWAGDAATFARVYRWTYDNLSRRQTQGDHLLAWHWGPRADGSWGVLDANTASDADLDYALALLLAARRGWAAPPGLPDYREEACRVQAYIWWLEVVHLPHGEFIITPGNWHEAQPPYLLNPSYFSPGAYHLFARTCPDNLEATTDWGKLRLSTYSVLTRMSQGLVNQRGVGLFPDWCRMDGAGGLAPAPERGSQFGWEAVRLPWRLALDRLWFGETRGALLLANKFLPFFQKEWQANGRLAAVYNFDGTPAVAYESPVLYAGVLAAAVACGDRDFARLLAGKIMSFYHQENGLAYFEAPDNYYANNWAWLGLALYAGLTSNFEK